jgi:hypothetical protein
MLHELPVGIVIGDVAEGDDREEKSDGCNERDLAETDDDHGESPRESAGL